MRASRIRPAQFVRISTLFLFASSGVISPIRAAESPRRIPSMTPAGAPAWAAQPMTIPSAKKLIGYASWYGEPYHGRPTASGEIYDMRDMTAAHPTLAMGSRLLVKNLANGKQVKVRINDRGPFVEGRIIDVSYAAALELGMTGRGVARVKISPVQ